MGGFGKSGSVKWGHISKEQEDEVERVRSLLSETERQYRNLVTERNLFESGLLQGMAGVIKGSTKVVVNIDEAEMQKRLRESRAKKAEKGGAQQATGKRPRDDDEGLVADVMGKRKALEEAHQDVMGAGPRLPPFDMQALPNDHRRHLLICKRRPILLGTKQILHQLSPMIIVPHKLRHIGAASFCHFKRTQSLVSLLYSQSGPVKSSDTNC